MYTVTHLKLCNHSTVHGGQSFHSWMSVHTSGQDIGEQLPLFLPLVTIKPPLALLPCHICYRSNRKSALKDGLVLLLGFLKIVCLFVFVRHLFARQYEFECLKPVFLHELSYF